MKKINKIIDIIKENKWIHYLIIIVIGIILSIPISKIQIRETHDGTLHMLRMMGTNHSLNIGQIPPIISPYFCNGGGYAMNLFYNPLVTYIPLLIKIFTPSYAMALKIFAGLCIVLSGITMYQFVYSVTKKRTIALFSAIIYLSAPYKLSDAYKRYAIGEFASFIFMPILFKGLYNLFNQDGKKHYYIAIGAIGLMLTHTVTTFYMAIFSAIYVLFNIKKLKEKEIIKKIAINVGFILLISLFFLGPMLEAKITTDYAIFDSIIMCTNGKYVYENTMRINDFFVDNVEDTDATVISIGIPIFVLMCLTVFTYKKVDKKYKDFFIISLFFSFICLYMSSRYCPWFLFPDFFCKLQYPWRLIGFFDFFISFVAGVNIYILLKMLFNKDLTRLIIVTLLTILTIIYTMPILLQFEARDNTIDEKYEEIVLEKKYIHYFTINRDYLPTKAIVQQRKYLMDREFKKLVILEGKAKLVNEEYGDLHYNAEIEDYKEGTILEFPFFFYPGYTINLEENGEITKLETMESPYGFVCTVIDKDIQNGKIVMEYKGTFVTNASYIISFIGLIVFIVYIIREEKYAKN